MEIKLYSTGALETFDDINFLFAFDVNKRSYIVPRDNAVHSWIKIMPNRIK